MHALRKIWDRIKGLKLQRNSDWTGNWTSKLRRCSSVPRARVDECAGVDEVDLFQLVYPSTCSPAPGYSCRVHKIQLCFVYPALCTPATLPSNFFIMSYLPLKKFYCVFMFHFTMLKEEREKSTSSQGRSIPEAPGYKRPTLCTPAARLPRRHRGTQGCWVDEVVLVYPGMLVYPSGGRHRAPQFKSFYMVP